MRATHRSPLSKHSLCQLLSICSTLSLFFFFFFLFSFLPSSFFLLFSSFFFLLFVSEIAFDHFQGNLLFFFFALFFSSLAPLPQWRCCTYTWSSRQSRRAPWRDGGCLVRAGGCCVVPLRRRPLDFIVPELWAHRLTRGSAARRGEVAGMAAGGGGGGLRGPNAPASTRHGP